MELRKIWLKIPGQVPRKSNSRRVVRHGGKVAVIKSKEAVGYLDAPYEILATVPNKGVSFRGLGARDVPVSVRALIYYPWHTRGDLSGEMVLDYLVHVGILSDDRYVRKQVWVKAYDKDNPRSIVIVEEHDSKQGFSL